MKKLSESFRDKSRFSEDMKTDRFMSITLVTALAVIPFSFNASLIILATPSIYQGLKASRNIISKLADSSKNNNVSP